MNETNFPGWPFFWLVLSLVILACLLILAFTSDSRGWKVKVFKGRVKKKKGEKGDNK